jgi:hypothetical protein
MGTADKYFPDTRKAVISLTSPLALLYATTLTKLRIHLMPNPINTRIHAYLPRHQSETEMSEILPPKLAPHTKATLNRTSLATELVAHSTKISSGLPSQKKIARPSTHHHITKRHKIILAPVSMNAHGSSLLGGSANLTASVNHSIYLAEDADRLLCLHITTRAKPSEYPTNNYASPHATAEGDNADQPTGTRPGNSYPNDQPMDMEVDPTPNEDRNPHPKNPITDTTRRQKVRSSKRYLLEALADSHAT